MIAGTGSDSATSPDGGGLRPTGLFSIPLPRLPLWVGPIAALAIFAAALFVIHGELAANSFHEFGRRLRELPPSAILAAIGFAIASYAALIANEAIALRALGKKLPLAEVWRPAFCAYALGNALGFSFSTAPAARARFYRNALKPGEIAALSGVTGAIVAASGAAATGFGLIAGASEIAATWVGHPILWRLCGLLLLAPAALAVIVSARGLAAEIGGAILKAPSPLYVTLLLAIGVLDWTAAAGILYALMPSHGGWNFPAFLAIFVAAGGIGAASGAPGGAGVFEAGMLALAPAAQHAPGALAALVVYRLIYTLAPLVVGATLLAQNIASDQASPASRVLRRTGGAAIDLAPQFFSIVTFASGLLLLASSATPTLAERLGPLERIAPLFVVEASHFAASLVGVLLLVVAAGLGRKSKGAYPATLFLLLVGALAALLKGLDYEETVLLLAAAAMLAPCRRAFTRRARLLSEALSLPWLAALIGAVGAAGWLGFFAYRDVAYTDELWWTFLRDADASRYLRAATAVCILVVVVSIWSLFAPPRSPWRGRPSADDLARATSAISSADFARSDSCLALVGDKDLFFSPTAKSFIMFRVRGCHWIAMSEPCGLRAERRDLLWRFVEAADEAGAAPVFYSVGEAMLPDLAEIGFAVRKIGETAIVPIQNFTLEGKSRAGLRSVRNRMEKDADVGFEVLAPGSASANAAALRQVSDAWLAKHAGAEKGFSLGRFDLGYLDAERLGVVRVRGEIVAFANLWTTADKNELSIDLMRFGADAPKGVMEYLFIKLIEWGKAEGYREFDLGMAPLAGLEKRRLAPPLTRLGAAVFDEAEGVYGFRGLRAYKDKFHPVWRPLYLAAPPSAMMPLALLDVGLLTSGGWRGLAAK